MKRNDERELMNDEFEVALGLFRATSPKRLSSDSSFSIPNSSFFFIPHPSKNWSGRRDLNSRPSPWQGDALPLSYSRFECLILRIRNMLSSKGKSVSSGQWTENKVMNDERGTKSNAG